MFQARLTGQGVIRPSQHNIVPFWVKRALYRDQFKTKSLGVRTQRLVSDKLPSARQLEIEAIAKMRSACKFACPSLTALHIDIIPGNTRRSMS
jgi:hypothetical protein